MEVLSSYLNWLEGLVLGSSNRKITGPCSKPSHFKEGPQKTSQEGKLDSEHTVWRVARGAMGQHVWGMLCTVIWVPLGGSSLFNPFQYLIWIYLLSPIFFHHIFDMIIPSSTRTSSHLLFFYEIFNKNEDTGLTFIERALNAECISQYHTCINLQVM